MILVIRVTEKGGDVTVSAMETTISEEGQKIIRNENGQ